MTAINSNRAIRGPITAVPVVAGKGVRFVEDTENNRIVAEADETVLWEGELVVNTSNSLVLSEVVTNFESIAIYDKTLTDDFVPYTKTIFFVDANTRTFCTRDGWVDVNWNPTQLASHYLGACEYVLDTDHKTLRTYGCYRQNMSSQAWASTTGKIVKVVGVNRIASN